MTEQNYIALEDAAQELKVTRSTLYYYRQQFGIELQRFPLDKRKYFKMEDFKRIKEAKQAATERKH
jgi:hypothetical protein